MISKKTKEKLNHLYNKLPVKQNIKRQFLRIVSSGVYGREDYFTPNPLIS